MSYRSTLFVLLALVLTGGCASTNKPEQKSNLSAGTVKTKLIKGKTSQAEVVSLLGSPNIVTRNGSGNEVWTYTKQSSDSESGGIAAGLLIIGGSKAFSSSASNSFDLIITFNKQDIIQDYTMMSSQF